MKSTKLYIRFFTFALITVLLHFFMLKFVQIGLDVQQLYIIHLFNFILSGASYLFIDFFIKLKNKIGFAFLGTSVLKMLVTLVYLGAVIINKPNIENFALQFVFIYLVYLFYDAFFAIKKLNN